MKSLTIPAFALFIAVSLSPAVHGQATAVPVATSAETPAFLKVGEWYVALYFGETRPVHFKVLERASGGWVKVEYRDEAVWLNTGAALLIKPGTKE